MALRKVQGRKNIKYEHKEYFLIKVLFLLSVSTLNSFLSLKVVYNVSYIRSSVR